MYKIRGFPHSHKCGRQITQAKWGKAKCHGTSSGTFCNILIFSLIDNLHTEKTLWMSLCNSQITLCTPFYSVPFLTVRMLITVQCLLPFMFPNKSVIFCSWSVSS